MGPKKSRFQVLPLQTPREIDFPPSKSIRPAPYIRYIGNFMDKRQETKGRGKRFQGPFREVYIKRVRSLRGRIKRVEVGGTRTGVMNETHLFLSPRGPL